jgi:SAM-dependent methyltransferase
MAKTKWVFDSPHYRSISGARKAFLRDLLSALLSNDKLLTAADLGCGLGEFTGLLEQFGIRTVGIDGRATTIAECRTRYPGARFEVFDVEDKEILQLGTFDIVLCFGLLYHLENPFRAVRNIAALTRKYAIIETMVVPSRLPSAILRTEVRSLDQGLNFIALIPSESCLTKMLYCAGFHRVYRARNLPRHGDFKSSIRMKRRRTVLLASRFHLEPQQSVLLPEPGGADLWSRGWFSACRVLGRLLMSRFARQNSKRISHLP